MDILASKIEEACQHGKKEWPPEEKSVMDVMIPLEEYTTLKGEETVKESIFSLKASFALKISTGRIMETGHRSILVFDDRGKVQGILAIVDLLEGIMPILLLQSQPRQTVSNTPPCFGGVCLHGRWKNWVKRKLKISCPQSPLLSMESQILWKPPG